MSEALVYALTNETTGAGSRHETLNHALDAVNDSVGSGDEWVIELWSHARPLRWVAEGRGHARVDEDMPTRQRRGVTVGARLAI